MVKHRKKIKDNAVSPVVGVMLMLVVTIIIAAVVSAFAGGLGTGQAKAPAISVSSHIRNDGTYAGSFAEFAIQSVDQPILTKDMKIVTSWTTTNKDDGTQISGGATVTGPPVTGSLPNYHQGSGQSGDYYAANSPVGFGAGVNRSSVMLYPPINVSIGGVIYEYYTYPDQDYGNYTLMGGTIMRTSPGNYGYEVGTYNYYSYTYVGNGRFKYCPYMNSYTSSDVDGMQALLGKNWENLRAGDTVKVQFVHLPSGKTIYNEKIVVEG
jgi:archaeal type IV pilus assembly protein PilA